MPRQEDGSCLLNINLELQPSESVAVVHERAFNPDLCRSVLEFGTSSDVATATASDAPTAALELEEPSAGAGLAPPTSPSDLVDAGGWVDDGSVRYVESAGQFKSYYEDPPQRDVTSVRNDTYWVWRTAGPRCASNVYGGYDYNHFGPSGWSRVSDNWQNYYTCAESTSSSYVHYKNPYFCASIDTHNYYNRNTINGRSDGVLQGKVNASKKGGCVRLLSFHAELKRTKN